MSWANNNKTCCKCGSLFVHGPKYEKDFHGSEHLRYTCVTCSYSWTEYTNDYPRTEVKTETARGRG